MSWPASRRSLWRQQPSLKPSDARRRVLADATCAGRMMIPLAPQLLVERRADRSRHLGRIPLATRTRPPSAEQEPAPRQLTDEPVSDVCSATGDHRCRCAQRRLRRGRRSAGTRACGLTRCSDSQRDICLIPSSAHGTVPATASARSACVVVCDARQCRRRGLQQPASTERLAALISPYPSTHGVPEAIRETCAIVHDRGQASTVKHSSPWSWLRCPQVR